MVSLMRLSSRIARPSILHLEAVSFRQLVANRFLVVAQKQKFTSQRRRVPGLGAEGTYPADFSILRRIGLHERDRAWLRLDQQQVVHQQKLTVAVTTVLPSPLACGQLKAGEDAVVQAIKESIPRNHVGKLRFHVAVFPDFRDREAAIAANLHLQ